MRRTLTKAAAVLGVIVVAACADAVTTPDGPRPAAPSLAAGVGKVTICHAAGRAGTTKFVQITISANAKNKHLDDHGTPAAGHEQDFLITPQTPCNAPAGVELTLCKENSGLTPDAAATFSFTSSSGDAIPDLHLGECTALTAEAGQLTITEAPDPTVPAPSSYFATDITATGAQLSKSGTSSARPSQPTPAVATLTLTAGQDATVTFFNRK